MPREVFNKKGVLENFSKLAEKFMGEFIQFTDLQHTFLKKLRHRCFPVSFAKFLLDFFAEHRAIAYD